MKWFSQAPSNIALIKYMGKVDDDNNIPLNSSLSYTLPHLIGTVELEYFAGNKDLWEPLEAPGFRPFELGQTAQQRYLEHLGYVKRHFFFHGSFIVRSCNNFPSDGGFASSAASFAALTKCTVRAICALTAQNEPDIEILADLSRHGSGSACCSFFSPWALWSDQTVSMPDVPYDQLLHQVIMISDETVTVPSMDVHQLIKTSDMFDGRAKRAEINLKNLLDALQTSNWRLAYEITWREFWDMHQLFATATPAFSYITPQCRELLDLLQEKWEYDGDGPLITMDAGTNIHLLYRRDQLELAHSFRLEHLYGNYDTIQSF